MLVSNGMVVAGVLVCNGMVVAGVVGECTAGSCCSSTDGSCCSCVVGAIVGVDGGVSGVDGNCNVFVGKAVGSSATCCKLKCGGWLIGRHIATCLGIQ